MREEMRERDGCEAKVQEYVQTLIAKNKELELQQQRRWKLDMHEFIILQINNLIKIFTNGSTI